MQRFHQLLFVTSLLALSWLAMMAVHELGHVVGALATGGTVKRVVLHPARISRTDVFPNPHPAVVVWCGPVLGCAIPLAAWLIVPRRLTIARRVAMFWAGFCLIANGAYIAVGSFDGVGDCGEMLRTGSPIWTLIVFGALTIAGGLLLWHRLGPARRFIETPSLIPARWACAVLCILLLVAAAEFAFSPR